MSEASPVQLAPERIVSLEEKGLIEDWRFAQDGSVHILLADPVKAICCGKKRAWFVNRDGSTLCFDCDDKRQAEAAARRFEILQRTKVLPI